MMKIGRSPDNQAWLSPVPCPLPSSFPPHNVPSPSLFASLSPLSPSNAARGSARGKLLHFAVYNTLYSPNLYRLADWTEEREANG